MASGAFALLLCLSVPVVDGLLPGQASGLPAPAAGPGLPTATTGAPAATPAGLDPGEVLATWPAMDGATDGARVLLLDREGHHLALLDPWSGSNTSIAPPIPAETARLEAPRLAGARVAVLRPESDGVLRLFVGAVDGDGNGSAVAWLPVRPVAGQLSPALAPDAVAFVDVASGHGDIWFQDRNGTRALTNDAAAQTSPALDADSVVWVDARNAVAGPIFAASTQAQRATASIRGQRMHPQNLDLYVFDRALGTVLQATNEPLEQDLPVLAGSHLAYRTAPSPGRLALAMRDRRSPLASLPQQVSSAGASLLAGDGDRLLAWREVGPDAVLDIHGLDDASLITMPAPTQVLHMTAGHGLVLMARVDEAGRGQAVLLRLPSSLQVRLSVPAATAAAAGNGTAADPAARVCLDATVVDAADPASAPAATLWLTGDGAPRRFEAPGGHARVCGAATATVRAVTATAASPAVPLAATPSATATHAGSAMGQAGLALALLALSAVVGARRRTQPAP